MIVPFKVFRLTAKRVEGTKSIPKKRSVRLYHRIFSLSKEIKKIWG